MLTRRLLAGAAAAALLFAGVAARAQGDEPDDALTRPDCLTAGIADQLLGQLAPDGKTLYFVSTRHTTHELYAENVDHGGAHLLFDEDADVTWPRVSPDGKSLLYVSFRDRADGRLCVRDLPAGGDRRCLDDDLPALEAEWIDATHVAALVRASIDGGLRLREVTVGSALRSRPLLETNLTTPAVSPDGRWLVYVPIRAYAADVGLAFAARAGRRLEVVSLEHPAAPVSLDVDLPGRIGQPAFSRDGRFLYFVQFFSDTNHDGIIDANDHGVLFRVPISIGPHPRVGTPEQLTDAAWNCQYPAPAADQLVATCAHRAGLDVYTLPLDGEVPSEWSASRLADETGLATKRADEQLLYARRLAKETSVTARRLVMVNLVRLHLDADEFRAAAFYVRHIGQLGDPATAGISRALATLVEHCRAVRERERGRRSDDFELEEQKRMDDLRELPTDSRAAVALMHVVRSEIADATGDKKRAKNELAAAALGDGTPHTVAAFYYARADALFRELDDRESLAAACSRLASIASLDLDDRLDYARAAVRAIVRGLPFDEADAALARERARAPDGSELAFALDLGRATLAIRSNEPPRSVRDAIQALYARQTRPDRRRAVVYEAVERAARFGADKEIEALARRYLADAQPGTIEQRRAARLFRRAMIGRANRRVAEGHLAEARADFDAVTDGTGSFESSIASMDVRLRSGETVAAIASTIPSTYAPSLRAFAKAYTTALALPSLDGGAFDRASGAALSELRAHWGDLKRRRAARALMGVILEQRFLRSGDLELAERANVHELVALDLVPNNARYRAMLLGDLGILHTKVGNFRIALSYLDARAALPYTDDVQSLGARLARARSLFHVGRDADAAHEADEALAMVDRTPALAPYRPLVLDLDALCNLSDGRYRRALALYTRLVPLVDDPRARTAEARRNRFVARLGRAAAALGAGEPAGSLDDLAVVDRALADDGMRDVLKWPHTSAHRTLVAYRLIVDGLRAHAFGALGRLGAEAAALDARRATLAALYARTPHRTYARKLSLVEAHLAENAMRRGDARAAGAWVTAALAHADAAHASDRAKTDFPQLDVLWLAAELGAFRRAPMTFSLAKRLDGAQSVLDDDDRPAARTYARWFDVYSALVETPSPR